MNLTVEGGRKEITEVTFFMTVSARDYTDLSRYEQRAIDLERSRRSYREMFVRINRLMASGYVRDAALLIKQLGTYYARILELGGPRDLEFVRQVVLVSR